MSLYNFHNYSVNKLEQESAVNMIKVINCYVWSEGVTTDATGRVSSIA